MTIPFSQNGDLNRVDQTREQYLVYSYFFSFHESSEELHARRYQHKPAPLLLELVFCDPCKEEVIVLVLMYDSQG